MVFWSWFLLDFFLRMGEKYRGSSCPSYFFGRSGFDGYCCIQKPIPILPGSPKKVIGTNPGVGVKTTHQSVIVPDTSFCTKQQLWIRMPDKGPGDAWKLP